jgi:lysophospholipase L1-like esterase
MAVRRSLFLVFALASRDGRSVEGVAPPPARAPRAIPPIVFHVDDAKGVPATTCDEALGRVPEPKPEPDRTVRPAPSTGTPDLASLPKITIEGLAFDRATLPGGNPAALTPRSLEGSREAIQAVGRVLLKAGHHERVRMSFFGASHTQGDFFTGRIRRVLQTRYGDIGHGFVFPAAITDGYRAQDVNLCRSDRWFADYVGKRDGREDGLYGLGGGSVSSGDAGQFGWIETTRSNAQGRSAASYDLFSLGQPTGGSVLVRIDDAAPVTIATRSEQAQMLRHRFEVPDGPHRFEVRPAGDGEVRLFGVSVERPGPGVMVDAIGIRGKTASTWLHWNRPMADDGLATLAPDLVALAYGANEGNDLRYTMEQYRKDLAGVLRELRTALPETACVLIGPSDRGIKIDEHTFGVWDRTRPIADVQREVAPEFGCAFWDWQAAMGGPGSMVGWYVQTPPLGSPDLLHFTQAGYERAADMFLAALDSAALDAIAH